MTLLRYLSDDPDRVVAAADIMPPATLALVTSEWPGSGQVADPGATAIARLWAACATDSVVAVGTDGSLTGKDVRATAAAHRRCPSRAWCRRIRPGRDPAVQGRPDLAGDARDLVDRRILRAA